MTSRDGVTPTVLVRRFPSRLLKSPQSTSSADLGRTKSTPGTSRDEDIRVPPKTPAMLSNDDGDRVSIKGELRSSPPATHAHTLASHSAHVQLGFLSYRVDNEDPGESSVHPAGQTNGRAA